jgi:hypothetical protein
VDYRKENWSHELECFRKAVNGNIDGYQIDIAAHYIVDRLENDEYADRTFTRADIAVAIFRGTIIEGYSSEQNRKRKSRANELVAPSRVILGQDLLGNWVIVVIGMLGSQAFNVVTCFPPTSPRYLEWIKEMEGENN